MDEDSQLSLFELSERFQRIEAEVEEELAPAEWVPVLLVVHEQGGPQ